MSWERIPSGKHPELTLKATKSVCTKSMLTQRGLERELKDA